jgi:hypothetical protein
MKYVTRLMKVTSLTIATILAVGVLGASPANAQGNQVAQNATQIIRALAADLLDHTSKTLNIDSKDILKDLAGGITLADYVKAHSTDPNALETIEDAVKADATDKITQAVKDGKIKQEQADKLTKRLPTAINRIATTKWPIKQNARQRTLTSLGLRLLLQETAKESNVQQRDLLQDLRNGQTLAQIATAHQADPAKIVSTVVTNATDRINKLVKNDKLKQEQADTLLKDLSPNLTVLMNKQYPLGQRGKLANNTQATPAK